MATDHASDSMSADEIAATMASIKKMIVVSGLFVLVGYLLLLFALSQEFVTVAELFDEDSMKMWLKLGGVGHILVGIFVSLVAIVRTLGLVPHRLAATLSE